MHKDPLTITFINDQGILFKLKFTSNEEKDTWMAAINAVTQSSVQISPVKA